MNTPPETIWTKSKWAFKELEGETVEFRFPASGGVVYGIGTFSVRRNPEGLLAVDVTTDSQGRSWAERISTHHHLSQIGVDRIEKHPDQSIATFQLM